MTKFFQLTLCCCLLLLAACTGGKKTTKAGTEGTVKYTLTGEGGQAAMLSGSTVEFNFSNGALKLEGSIMGGMMEMKMLLNDKDKKGMVLVNAMGQKKAGLFGETEINNLKNAERKAPEGIKFEETGNKKEIAGITCREIKMSKEGETQELMMYVTDKISLSVFDLVNLPLPEGMPGFPVALEFEENGSKIKIEATEITLTAPAKEVFKAEIPEGYEEMSKEEIDQMTKGGQLGGGL